MSEATLPFGTMRSNESPQSKLKIELALLAAKKVKIIAYVAI